MSRGAARRGYTDEDLDASARTRSWNMTGGREVGSEYMKRLKSLLVASAVHIHVAWEMSRPT